MPRFLLTLLRSALLLSAGLALSIAPVTRAQATAQQNIVDFQFDPVEVVVPAGTTVVWTNVGPTIHTVAARDMSWSSEILPAGATFSRSFDAPGTYPIWCTLHPDMQGNVVVQ